MQDNWERILVKYGAGLLLTNFISQIVPLVSKWKRKIRTSESITVLPDSFISAKTIFVKFWL